MFQIENYNFKTIEGKTLNIDEEFSLTKGNLTIHGLTLRNLIFKKRIHIDSWLNLDVVKLSDGVYTLFTNGEGALNEFGKLNFTGKASENGIFLAIMLEK